MARGRFRDFINDLVDDGDGRDEGILAEVVGSIRDRRSGPDESPEPTPETTTSAPTALVDPFISDTEPAPTALVDPFVEDTSGTTTPPVTDATTPATTGEEQPDEGRTADDPEPDVVPRAGIDRPDGFDLAPDEIAAQEALAEAAAAAAGDDVAARALAAVEQEAAAIAAAEAAEALGSEGAPVVPPPATTDVGTDGSSSVGADTGAPPTAASPPERAATAPRSGSGAPEPPRPAETVVAAGKADVDAFSSSDLDGDGLRDFEDDDIDGDGLEAAGLVDDDRDGDGIADDLDTDDDGDGFRDDTEQAEVSVDDAGREQIEFSGTTPPVRDARQEDLAAFAASDLDDDGEIDFEDDDIDGDGLANAVDPDDDDDGTADLFDDDRDGDGFVDRTEVLRARRDPVADVDTDVEVVGAAVRPRAVRGPAVEGTEETVEAFAGSDLDLDGLRDFEDADIDGDGVANTVDDDDDDDGLLDVGDTDRDGDGFLDETEQARARPDGGFDFTGTDEAFERSQARAAAEAVRSVPLDGPAATRRVDPPDDDSPRRPADGADPDPEEAGPSFEAAPPDPDALASFVAQTASSAAAALSERFSSLFGDDEPDDPAVVRGALGQSARIATPADGVRVASSDRDGDGLADFFDPDLDGDGTDNRFDDDRDDDGVPDDVDIDVDQDGFVDLTEEDSVRDAPFD